MPKYLFVSVAGLLSSSATAAPSVADILAANHAATGGTQTLKDMACEIGRNIPVLPQQTGRASAR